MSLFSDRHPFRIEDKSTPTTVVFTLYGSCIGGRIDREQALAKYRNEQLSYSRPRPRQDRPIPAHALRNMVEDDSAY